MRAKTLNTMRRAAALGAALTLTGCATALLEPAPPRPPIECAVVGCELVSVTDLSFPVTDGVRKMIPICSLHFFSAMEKNFEVVLRVDNAEVRYERSKVTIEELPPAEQEGGEDD